MTHDDKLMREAYEPTLRPCPFCGEYPNLLWVKMRYGPYAQREGWTVECKDMGCIIGRTRLLMPDKDIEALILAWNWRKGENKL